MVLALAADVVREFQVDPDELHNSLRDLETLEDRRTVKPDLYQRVALRLDVTEHGLKKGDVEVLVDRVPHPSGGEAGVVLEVFNAIGESISVIAVKESDIEPLHADLRLITPAFLAVYDPPLPGVAR